MTTPRFMSKSGVNADLKSIAEDTWSRILRGWQFSTPELEAQYNLTEVQSQTVKRYVRKISAKQGVLWGWYPKVEKFIMVPDNAPDIARDVLRYYVEHWQEAGRAVHLAFEAAHGQGYADDLAMKLADTLWRGFDRQISKINNHVSDQAA